MMSATDSGSGVDPSPVQNIAASYARIQRQYQQTLDRLTPHTLYRWVGFAGLLGVFFLRIVFAQGVCLFPTMTLQLLTLSSGILVRGLVTVLVIFTDTRYDITTLV